jgi:hypothetical protein
VEDEAWFVHDERVETILRDVIADAEDRLSALDHQGASHGISTSAV